MITVKVTLSTLFPRRDISEAHRVNHDAETLDVSLAGVYNAGLQAAAPRSAPCPHQVMKVRCSPRLDEIRGEMPSRGGLPSRGAMPCLRKSLRSISSSSLGTVACPTSLGTVACPPVPEAALEGGGGGGNWGGNGGSGGAAGTHECRPADPGLACRLRPADPGLGCRPRPADCGLEPYAPYA